MEISCKVLDNLDFGELALLYNSSTTMREYVRSCVRFVRMDGRNPIPMDIARIIFSLPELRTTRGIYISVETPRDVGAITGIPERLEGTIFYATDASVIPFLIQRVVDIIGLEKFAGGSWIFYAARTLTSGPAAIIVLNYAVLGIMWNQKPGTNAAIHYLRKAIPTIVAGPPVEQTSMEESLTTAYSAYSSELAYPHIATALFRKIYEEAELGSIDPEDTSSPRVKEEVITPLWGIVGNEDYIVLLYLALEIELALNGRSEKLQRWSSMQTIHRDNNPLRYMWITEDFGPSDLEDVDIPPPYDEEVRRQGEYEDPIIRGLKELFYHDRYSSVYVSGKMVNIRLPEEDIRDGLLGTGWDPTIVDGVVSYFGHRRASRFPRSFLSSVALNNPEFEESRGSDDNPASTRGGGRFFRS